MGQCFDALGGNAAATHAAGMARKRQFSLFLVTFQKGFFWDSCHEVQGQIPSIRGNA